MKPAVLFRHIQVVTPMPIGPVVSLSDAFVAVCDGKIRYVGASEGAAVETLHSLVGDRYDTYDGQRKILWPAMANAHGHIPMTLMRNQADDYNLQAWLFDQIFPREAHLTPEHVLNGTRLGMAEMIRSGTGTAADMYYFSESVVEAAVESGMRLHVCRDGKEIGPDGKPWINPKILEDFSRLCRQSGDGMIRPAMLLHSIYLYEPEIYPEIARVAADLEIDVQVHIGETASEVTECLARYGARPAVQLEAFGFFKTRTIAAHCVHLNADERKILARPHVLVSHNPTSNLKLGSGIADLLEMLTAGIRVGFGTDGAASNNNLNLYQEMRLASLLAKGVNGDASILPADQAIRMATYTAQSGMGFEQSGCIAVGFDADLQILDADRPAMWPLGESAAALVYSADGAFVESLMVNGRWLLYKHDLLTIDEEKAKAEALRSAAKLNATA
jgi:5-methylthioadenosine/S-adenosylhomocysteine deaminase